MYKMNMLGGSVGFLESQFQQRLVQVCLFAAILFWILGSYNLIDQVQKLLSKVGLRFGKDSTRVVHALIFAVLLYLLTRFIMDPVVRRAKGSVVEGQTNTGAGDTPQIRDLPPQLKAIPLRTDGSGLTMASLPQLLDMLTLVNNNVLTSEECESYADTAGNNGIDFEAWSAAFVACQNTIP